MKDKVDFFEGFLFSVMISVLIIIGELFLKYIFMQDIEILSIFQRIIIFIMGFVMYIIMSFIYAKKKNRGVSLK